MTNRLALLSILALVAFKIIAIYFTKFTLYGDEAQYWLWSKSPGFGYFSKPPLLAWFLSGYTNVFGDSFISLKIFPTVIYFFISLSVYRLCLSLSFSKDSSILCSISFFLIPAVSFSSFLISTDLLLLLFWTLTMTKLLNLRSHGSTINFLLLGLFLGLSFIAKYAAIYFVLSLVLLIIFDKKTYNAFKNNLLGVCFFLGSLVLIILPNIFWNINNGWVTLAHTSNNASLQNLSLSLYEPLEFLVAQILMVGPVLFFAFILLIKNFNFDFENKFLLIFSLPIIFIVLIESFLVRANANWAAPALISIFILLFKVVNNNKVVLIKLNFVFNYLICVFLFAAILTSSKHNIFDRIRGVDDFTKDLLEIINDKDIVVSDRITFANISYELRNNKNILFMPHKKGSSVTNHFQMTSALSELREDDFYLIGELDDISYLLNSYKTELVKEFFIPLSSSGLKLYAVNFK
tara:strand:+ start:1675 stop:3063 length:1389 start_codon:yes stop_codon:yes gene_type:complete